MDASEIPRFSVVIESFGTVDGKGRPRVTESFETRRVVAEPDCPLALVVAILERMLRHHHYSSREAATVDFARLREFAVGLHVE